MSYKLSCHKIVVGGYGFIFLKWLETVVTNHDFNFKFKAVVGDYGFDFFFKMVKAVVINCGFNFIYIYIYI